MVLEDKRASRLGVCWEQHENSLDLGTDVVTIHLKPVNQIICEPQLIIFFVLDVFVGLQKDLLRTARLTITFRFESALNQQRLNIFRRECAELENL